MKNVLLAVIASSVIASSAAQAGSIPQYHIETSSGKVSRAAVNVAVRKLDKGVNPKIRETPSVKFPNCREVRWMAESELKRAQFNCVPKSNAKVIKLN